MRADGIDQPDRHGQQNERSKAVPVVKRAQPGEDLLSGASSRFDTGRQRIRRSRSFRPVRHQQYRDRNRAKPATMAKVRERSSVQAGLG